MDRYISIRLRRYESLYHYRRRLRVIVEDLALLGMPRSIASIFSFWKYGLRGTIWDKIAWEVRFHAVPFYLTDVQLIYVLEHILSQFGHVGEATDVVFLVSAMQPSPYEAPDFGVWDHVGMGTVFARDHREVHADMMHAIEQGIFALFAGLWMIPPLEDLDIGGPDVDVPIPDQLPEPTAEPIPEPQGEPDHLNEIPVNVGPPFPPIAQPVEIIIISD